jgi:hypothetical protein
MSRIRTEGLAAAGTSLTVVFLGRCRRARRSRVEPALRGLVLDAVWPYGTM